MAGPGAGFVRLVLETETFRYPVTALAGKNPITAARLLELLPVLERDLLASLERISDREKKGPVLEHRPVVATSTASREGTKK